MFWRYTTRTVCKAGEGGVKVKVKHSFRDTRGSLWIACSECERGGNGADTDKCACGGTIKRGCKMGCFQGVLMGQYEVPEKVTS